MKDTLDVEKKMYENGRYALIHLTTRLDNGNIVSITNLVSLRHLASDFSVIKDVVYGFKKKYEQT
ncbi:MAG: hypothetical protein AAB922_05840 [Patescibacteria group bacterium]